MPQLTEYTNLPSPPFNQSNLTFPDTTIRQTLHMSIGASQIRLRISNAFGISPLPITAINIALPFNGSSGTSAIQTSTIHQLTFSGNQSIVIPNGALAVSDPINFYIAPQSELAVTMYLAEGQTTNYITSHPGSRATTWYSTGNQINAANLTITNSTIQSAAHWFFLSAVEAWSPRTSRAFAVIGDSITDGRGSDTDGNDRWPDLVLRRLQANPATSDIAVVNQAAGGNRVLADGLGPNAIGRIDRDVLSQSGIKYAMIFEGVNDIGDEPTDVKSQRIIGDRLIQAYQQIITRVHARNIPIFGATITPFGAPNSTIQPYSDPQRESTRQRVNNWIRTSGKFDAVIDFDAIVRDPANQAQLNPAYNSGDYLHPNVSGYEAIAAAFPLDLFARFKHGVSGFM
ncbi:extracellular GDSL-like lipase/acylhydrolase [Myriangium duriaei CBS 260.36]|uniref:Extracellular GDSL-like lipase/acylhydrolase n=1 Tax=Myriangium duriaei CBS 260.36 TaxID=1168546 RepID=A0A9P4JEK6_9PEZI|nr:extracellular GDSL-like lipase/acylhydrolase [Myriangium duriaei CBS 260.36]